MGYKKGVVHLLLPLIVIAVVFVVLYLLFGKKLLTKLPSLSGQPKVALKEDYQNPFDRKTQYVNPFDKFKNPFEVARQ